MESPKYNRTFHFPWSPGATNDDKIATTIDQLIGVPIIITEKMDGSNTSLEADGCFARTHSGPPSHPSFDGLKAFHATIKYLISNRTQLFGEWCYAKHSIEYSELPGYFLLFNVRDTQFGIWSSWEEVECWANEIGAPTVPVLFEGEVSNEKELKGLVESFMNQSSACGGIREGVVARVAKQFMDNEFSSSIMKCVRANHVQTSEHWKDQEIIRNKLKALDSP
jgi:RNA ligase